MNELSEFLHMGGRGQYVWSAYAVWLLIIVGVVVFSLYRGRQIRRQLSTKYRLETIESETETQTMQASLSEDNR